MVLSSFLKVSLAVCFCLFFFVANVADAQILAGVKSGDWIEYTVKTTGLPPKDFAVTWAKMEITSVQGTVINTKVTTKPVDGTLSSRVMVFDLEKGEVGAWFIIPAGLNVGDCFWDNSLGRNVTIEGEQQLSFAGATEAITNATTPQRLKYWDKATGVFVECVDVFEDYSINATAVKTNMWGPSEIMPQRIALNVGVLVVGFIAVVTTLSLIATKTKKTRI